MATPGALERHNLAAHPEFGAVLEKVAAELRPDLPPTQVPAFFRARGRRHDFLLDPGNFSVVDAGQPTHALDCIVCGVGSRRQYAFYVRCADGSVQGPVGSSCIFEHVLGVHKARGYGNSLRALVRDLPHYRQHRSWLEDAHLDYDAYLRRAALAYLTDAGRRAQAQLTRTQQQALDRLRAAGQPLPPTLYAALLQRGQDLDRRSPPPVPAEPDLPLSADLRSRAREHQDEVLSALPAFTRAFVLRALEDSEVRVASYLRWAIEEAVEDAARHAEGRERQSRSAKRPTRTARPRPAAAALPRLAAPWREIVERWPELQPFVTPETQERVGSFLRSGGGTLTAQDRHQLNRALQEPNQERERRWARQALLVWPSDADQLLDGALLRAALERADRQPLIAALEGARPLNEKELLALRQLAQPLLNPQPQPALRNSDTFLQLVQAVAFQHQITTTLAKTSHHRSWLNALREFYADFLQGRAVDVPAMVNVLRRHQANRKVKPIVLPPRVISQVQARWSTLQARLSPDAQGQLTPPLGPQHAVSLTIFEEVLHALAQLPPAPTPVLPPERPTPPPQSAPAAAWTPALRPVPLELLVLIRKQPQLLSRISPGLRPTLEAAVRDGTRLAPGLLQLLELTAREFTRGRTWQAFVSALAEEADRRGHPALARDLVARDRAAFWRHDLAAVFEGYRRGTDPNETIVLHAAQRLEQESAPNAAVSGAVAAEPAAPDQQRDARHFLDALARQAGRLGQRETARKLADPALENRWLALLPAGWRSYRQDGVVTAAAVKAALERAQGVD
ncbi:hypothetical protein QOL99_04700 [Deinococcus sp. MIMF12]|uniref:Uncharacterized protein n=1 Tax=Deinococcus rhizophilus TaxID=3049544 RepID=A0ABT7JEG1_9DEIO|nr:hypothetical protein [Deinococcus rhizophilus]MDL2343449.1 hypothetical protein [Deinococcus rhizophilus]